MRSPLKLFVNLPPILDRLTGWEKDQGGHVARPDDLPGILNYGLPLPLLFPLPLPFPGLSLAGPLPFPGWELDEEGS
jgi:hypothetical protein